MLTDPPQDRMLRRARSGDPSRTATLELRGVSKTFGVVRALRDVSVRLHGGSVTALVGENGAGKSTLASVVAGLYAPDSGEVLIDGEPVTLSGPRHAHELGIRIAPQELQLCEHLSVAENICMGALPGGRLLVDRRGVHELATERLATLGVDHIDPSRRVADLPLVGKTLVQIARALEPGARVLIVDEPTAPMSAGEADQLLGVIRRVTESGVATVYVSHHLDEVFRLADEAVVLRDGAVAGRMEGGELTHDALISAMVGDQSLALDRTEPDLGAAVITVADLECGSVQGVSLEVRAGEVAAVYGIAGSGREELGAAIMHTVPPQQGTVTVNGRRVDSTRSALEAGVGYVPPERRSQGLVLGLTVRENTTLSVLRRLTRFGVVQARREREVATRWVRDLDVATPTIEKPVGQLSGGSQQKVLLARALAAGGGALVLEEPTRGVDIGTKAEIHRLVQASAAAGAAVLVVSSDIEEVVAVADRVMVMRKGRIVRELVRPTQEALATAALKGAEPATSDPNPGIPSPHAGSHQTP